MLPKVGTLLWDEGSWVGGETWGGREDSYKGKKIKKH